MKRLISLVGTLVGRFPRIATTKNDYKSFTADRERRPVTIEDVDLVLNGSQTFGTYNFIFGESRVSL